MKIINDKRSRVFDFVRENQDIKKRKPVFFNFSNDKHYECVAEMFGGEKEVEDNYPLLHEIMQNTRKLHTEKFVKPIVAQDSPTGFCDGIYIRDVSYDKDSGLASASGHVLLTEQSQRIYLSISIYYKGDIVGHNANFVSGVSSLEIFCTANIPEIDPNEKKLECVLQSTWQPAEQNYLCSGALEQTLDYNTEDVIDTAICVDPQIKDTTSKRNYSVVTFGRQPSPGEVADYVYPETRKERLQAFYLRSTGTVFLKNGYTFERIDSSNTSMMFTTQIRGIITYNNANGLTTTTTENGFTYSFDDDWENVIKRSEAAGNELCSFDLFLSFFCKNDTNSYMLQVSSGSLKPTKAIAAHSTTIPFVKIYWGCLAKDSLIRMADGTTKNIADIQIGDNVRTLNGTDIVTNIWTGTEQNLWCMKSYDGEEVRGTETHPFMTNNGFKALCLLDEDDKVQMEDGTFSPVEYRYPVRYDDKVYNLSLKSGSAFIANGYVSGNMEDQNKLPSLEERKIVKIPMEIYNETQLLKRKWNEKYG